MHKGESGLCLENKKKLPGKADCWVQPKDFYGLKP